MSPNKTKKTKMVRVVEGLWLDLLVNLSFSIEGQNMILKVNGKFASSLEEIWDARK